MKNKFDPRHLHRQKILQELFAWSYFNSNPLSTDSEAVIAKILEIDQLISLNAPKWPLDKINRIDLSILRLAFYEILTKPELPVKVVVDEAVELAKEFGSDASSSFVNGVLGAALKKIEEEHEKA